MKLTNLKATAVKVVTCGLLAGAVAMAAPKAEAQVVVRFGAPVFVAPAPVYAGYYRDGDRFRREEFERREAWERHERFEHRDLDHDRDHRGWDRR